MLGLFLFIHLAVASEFLSEKFAFKNEKGGPQTEVLLVVRDGKTLVEKTAGGWSTDQPHLMWSVSKSLTAMIIGAAIDKKILKASDSICLGADLKLPTCQITVDHLLSWASGLEWNEEYEGEGDDQTKSSVIEMLSGDGRDDMFSFVVHHKIKNTPGKNIAYSTGDTTALMGVLKNAIHDKNRYNKLPWELLFDPLKISHATFEQDTSGTFIGGAWSYLSAQDLLKLGQYLLKPSGFVSTLLNVSPSGAGDFLKLKSFWRPRLAMTGDMPASSFSANGHWGQFLFVIPELKTIVVRLANDRDKQFDAEQFLKLLMADLQYQPLVKKGYEAAVPVPRQKINAIKYQSSLGSIGSHYGSRMYCACRFVEKQSEEYCKEIVKVKPDVIRIREEQKTIKGSVYGFYKSEAEYVDEHMGCKTIR